MRVTTDRRKLCATGTGERLEDDVITFTAEGLTPESQAKLRVKEEATDAQRRRWREGTAALAVTCLALGGMAAGAWWAQGEENQEQPLSMNFHGEQALAVLGIALLIVGLGVAVGRHIPGEARRRRNRTGSTCGSAGGRRRLSTTGAPRSASRRRTPSCRTRC